MGKSNLMKAGSEGFAMLDEYFRQKAGSKQPPSKQQQQQQQQQEQQFVCNYFRHQPPKPHVVQVIVPVPEAKEAARIDCYEAAKVYGGTVISEYPNTQKPTMRYAP